MINDFTRRNPNPGWCAINAVRQVVYTLGNLETQEVQEVGVCASGLSGEQQQELFSCLFFFLYPRVGGSREPAQPQPPAPAQAQPHLNKQKRSKNK